MMSALRPFFILILLLGIASYSYAGRQPASFHPALLDKSLVKSQVVWQGTLGTQALRLDQIKNIGHLFLDIETPLQTVTQEMYELVDEVIRRVELKLLENAPQEFESNHEYALNALATIDEVMTDLNFVYPPDSRPTHTFGESLRPTKLTKKQVNELLNMSVNSRRWDHISKNYDKHFYLSDCDAAAVMYLAVGEALNLPIFMVEVPQHAFVRWYFNDKDYLNWETTSGRTESDERYAKDGKIPQAAIDKGIYLSKMTRSKTIGFSNCIVATALSHSGAYRKAEDLFRIGIQTYKDAPLALHNFASMLVHKPDASEQERKEAIELTTQAIGLFEHASFFRIRAMAYAELGENSKAMQSESRAQELYELERPRWRSWLKTLPRLK